MTGHPKIENHTFDEISLGEAGRLSRAVDDGDSELFGLISDLLATEFPGPGTIILSQSLRLERSVSPGEIVTATVTVLGKDMRDHVVTFDCRGTDERGEEVFRGNATARPPANKIRHDRADMPNVPNSNRDKYHRLIDATSRGEPVPTAVVHPCNAASITAAADAARHGLIVPILVGPETKIRKATEEAGEDLSAFRIVPVPHSHAAARRGVALVCSGEAALLMKGSLHTDELMGAVVEHGSGLRTERRISHVYIMDVPGYPKPLLITDAAINIAPTLQDKADIVRNAIDLAHVIGIDQPKVAILSAVETVTPEIASTLDAAALCKMADRGQITGGLLDGPLAFDNAISAAAAREKEIHSPVAGQADILVVPNIEAGNMLAKQLTFLGGADAAGIVVGARVPIILTSRADNPRTRLASCAVAVLLANANTKAAPGLPPKELA